MNRKRARSDGGHLLLSQVFGALAHQRRRYILYYLHNHNQTTTDDLASLLVAWEQAIPLDAVANADIEQVKTELVYSHLPKLAEDGFIEVDQRSDTVCYTIQPEFLDDILELAATIEKPS